MSDSLQEKLDEYRKGMVERISADTLAVIRKVTAELIRSGIVDRGPRVGNEAPDFSLHNVKGLPWSLSENLGRGPVVLTFYRGVW